MKKAKGTEVKQFVLMNKKTGQLACGVRFSYFDFKNANDMLLDNLEGYRVAISAREPDAWAIQCGNDQIWGMVPADAMEAIEVLCEL